MKKLKIFTLLGILTVGFVVGGFAACNKGDLAAPTDFDVDLENLLTWSDVEDARSYQIEIKNVATGETIESSAKREYVSLAELAVGDYEIRIKSIGGKEGEESEWSETYYFHRAYETGCLYRLINNSEYEITAKGSASGVVTIEDIYRGKPVTSIADSAFRKCWGMEELIIGNNVRSIGESAFLHCKDLKSVVIPESVVSIGISAFQNCSALTSVNIPESIVELPDYTFAYCKSLAEISLHNKLTTIGEAAFLECGALTEVTIPDSVKEIKTYAFDSAVSMTTLNLGSGVETIAEHAFSNCAALKNINFAQESSLEVIGQRAFSDAISLESVVFPEGLTELGYASFYGTEKLNDIDLPDTLMHLSAFAFTGSKLYKDTWASGVDYVYIDDWLIACSNKVKGLNAEGKSEEGDEIVGLKELLDSEASITDPTTQATLREGTVGIADEAFFGSVDLMRVALPASIRAIGDYAFFRCPNLRGINTNKTQLIGKYAFSESKGLTQVDLGRGLKTIDSYAFYNCAGLDNNQLKSIIPDTVERIGTFAFKNTKLWGTPDESGLVYAGDWVVGFNGKNPGAVTLKKDIYGKDSKTRGIADYAFYQCATLQSISGLSDVQYIGRAAFYECSSLGLVTLGRAVKTIEDYTFYKCSSLSNVTLLGGITEIGRSAFYKCENLSGIDLSRCDVEKIGLYAFYGCKNLRTVDLGKDLHTLENNAFYKCSSLQEVTIPDTLTQIGDRVFYKCESLERVQIGENVESIGKYAFQGCTSLKELTLPDSVKTLDKNAFYKCSSLESITFGAGIEKISDYAFFGAENLYSVSIPSGVTIGKYAFKGANALTSLVLSKDVKSIGDHAFYGCKQMTIYTDATSAEEAGWSNRFNSSYRPVVWGCVLSEDKTYVVSVTIGENTLSNVQAKLGFKAPEKDNGAQRAIGWTTTEGGEVVYAIDDIVNVPVGTTLYPVWAAYEPVISFVHNVDFKEYADYVPLTETKVPEDGIYGALALQAPVESEYVFGGYYVDSLFTKEFIFKDNPITKDTIVYVRWLTLEEWEAMQQGSDSKESGEEESSAEDSVESALEEAK